MTPSQVRDSVFIRIGEPEGIFHVQDAIATYVQHGEELASMLRAFSEKVLNLNLVYNQPLYPVHDLAMDFIYPLRVTLQKRQLFQTTLAKIVTRDPCWLKTIGEPKFFFMMGCSQMGFYPLPPSSSLSVRILYVAQPPTVQGNTPFLISPEWHEALIAYSSAILLAKEQKYDLASAFLQEFLVKIGLPRDPRFGPPETKGTRAGEPLHPSSEAILG